jgi:anti-sigma B factor antagonist
MEISITPYKHCDVVNAKGRIDSATASQLGTALDDLTSAGRYRIVLDMHEVDYMSSAGLRVLIGTQKNCKRYNRGELILARVPKRIYDALELAGFVPLFKFHDDLLTAVGSF